MLKCLNDKTIHQPLEREIRQAQKQRHPQRNADDRQRIADRLFPRRPGNLFELNPDFIKKIGAFCKYIHKSVRILTNIKQTYYSYFIGGNSRILAISRFLKPPRGG